jgi:integrase/recombinase XerD
LGEALNLRVGDIDAGRGQVHIRNGKGHKDRFIVLPALTLACLRRYWREHRHRELLFPGNGSSGTSVMDRGSTQKAFARVIADCKINKDVSIHSLRHAYATHLIEVGLKLRGVQELLGHSCPKTTARYVHMTDKCRDDRRSLIDGLMVTRFDTKTRIVSFRYIDAKTQKPATRELPIADFLWRVLQHVLPSGLRRVRDYGFLHGKAKLRLKLVQLVLRVMIKVSTPTSRPVMCYPQCQRSMQIVLITIKKKPDG